jgi:ferritin
VFENSYAHEQTVTQMINALYGLAQNEPAYATIVLRQWFISEQVEEAKNAKLVVDQLKMARNSPSAILILDRELGARKDEDEGEGDYEFAQLCGNTLKRD